MNTYSLRFLSVASVVAVTISLSCVRMASNDPHAQALAQKVEIIQTTKQIVVGLQEFDLLSRTYHDLNVGFTFNDPQGKSLGQFEFDYTSAAARSHLVFEKNAADQYHSVSLTFRDGKKKLLTEKFTLSAVLDPAPTVPLTNEKAFVIPGFRTDAKTLPTEILLPDYAKSRVVTLADATRRWNLEGSVKRIVSSLNFPSMGAMNNSVISLQTAHPDDPARRSQYDSVKSTLYDQKTGASVATLKYLVEIPLDEQWRLGDGDMEVVIPTDKLRVHITDEKVDSKPNAGRITGSDSGGLMQLTSGVAADDDGNMYFSTEDELIRFNIKKNAFEKAPFHIVEYARTFLPKLGDIPASEGAVKGMGYNFFQLFYGGNDRLYLSFANSSFNNGEMVCSAVISVPTRYWENAEAFQKEIKLNAASWPTSPFPLYPTWTAPAGELRKLNHMIFIHGRVCMLAYDKNHFWVMDVDENGNTKRLLKLTTLAGRKIVAFDYPKAASAGDSRGILVPVEVGENKEKMDAFLADNATEWVIASAETIKNAHFMNYRGKSGARIRSGTTVYGMRQYSKETIASLHGKTDFGKGTVLVYYDIVDWLRKNPKGLEDLIAQMNGPSMGPQFLVSAIPGEGMKVLGNSEYGGYYYCYFDYSNPEQPLVNKTHLFKSTNAKVQIPLGAGMGPYGYFWRRENGADVIYYAGYTGIGRMPVRKDGKILASSTVEKFATKDESVDSAPLGYTMWYRDILSGLGDKLFVTGVAEEARSGTAYSGGLGCIHTGNPTTLKRLTGMTSCHFSARLDSRIVVTADGRATQEIYMPANFGITTGAKTIPSNKRSKLFCYRDDGSDRIEDRFGFSLLSAAEEAQYMIDFGVARNQLYGIVLLSNGTLATIDLTNHRFIDAVRVTNRIQSYDRNVDVLNPMPDGTHLLCTADVDKRSVTFHRVNVDPQGRLQFETLLTCDIGKSGMYPNWRGGEFALVYDTANDDGSYDLVMGARYPQQEGAQLFVIPDVVPPSVTK